MSEPRFVSREAVFASRPERAGSHRFAGLWVAGTLRALSLPTAAVVGSRAPSDGGRARARELAAALARAGVCVISGLALGIDGAAHAGALAGNGPTVGVLGGGHRHFFPSRNRALAEAMVAAGGAVVSPFAPDEVARPWQFLQRNAVVVALADVVVVVEAAERSGALNTASWAAASNVDVLAFPGDVDRPKAAGCNALIRDGAVLVRHAADVLDALGIAPQPELPLGPADGPATLAGNPATLADGRPAALAARLVTLLAAAPQPLDDLITAVGEPPGAVLAALVALELQGTVERRDAATFALHR